MQCGIGTEEEQKNNLNLSSIVIRATYGSQSYLFMGDATNKNEEARNWPQTNVLKVGHHGSDTSTSKKFLEQIKPQLAIISVGTGNDYGHPKDSTLKKLSNIGAKIYRTDKNGTITITSNGTSNMISTEK
jgi:competence protein ComEC